MPRTALGLITAFGVAAVVGMAVLAPRTPDDIAPASTSLVDFRVEVTLVQPPQFCEVEFTVYLRNTGGVDKNATVQFLQDRIVIGERTYAVPAGTVSTFTESFDTDCSMYPHRFSVLLA